MKGMRPECRRDDTGKQLGRFGRGAPAVDMWARGDVDPSGLKTLGWGGGGGKGKAVAAVVTFLNKRN